MKKVTGDLVELALRGKFDIIVHGCNCRHGHKSGIVVPIYKTFPAALEADLKTPKGPAKLGKCSWATIEVLDVATDAVRKLYVVNGYTQDDWWTPGRRTDYDAVRSVFREVGKRARMFNHHVGYPLIGAGRGGGSWDIISTIIDEELVGVEHTLVVFDGIDPFMEKKAQTQNV